MTLKQTLFLFCLVFLALGDGENQCSTDRACACVTFYRDCNYAGTSWQYCVSDDNHGLITVHSVSYVGNDENDQFSSFKFEVKFRVNNLMDNFLMELHSDANFWGDMRDWNIGYTPNVASIDDSCLVQSCRGLCADWYCPSYLGCGNWNDVISSLRLTYTQRPCFPVACWKLSLSF